MDQAPAPMSQQPEGNGPLVGIIIIVLILLVGGIYLVAKDKQEGNVDIDTATSTEEVTYEGLEEEAAAAANLSTEIDTELDALEKEAAQ